MEEILFVYDNREKINPSIKNIVGLDTYGQIIYKTRTLRSRLKDLVEDCDIKINYYYLNSHYDLERLMDVIKDNNKYIHFYSHSIITDREKFNILVNKFMFVNETMVINKTDASGFVFNSYENYHSFLMNKSDVYENNINLSEISPSDCIKSIASYDNFLTFFSGGFEARHFNSITGDKYTITKTSNKIVKIKSEHDYYYLIPNNMKPWFVTPFNYEENAHTASYSMERINAPDMALQWVHEAISLKDFDIFLEKLFCFIDLRAKKSVSKEEYQQEMNKLYVDKVNERITILKEMPEYNQLSKLLVTNDGNHVLDTLLERYFNLFKKIVAKTSFDPISVIGHGDLCFSNMLYYKEINMLKFIDVKGALKEDDLWTDPYYDLAKLSHSICGNYDYFNNNMYELTTNNECEIELTIMNKNLGKYKEIFKNYLNANHFNYNLVRLFEASLFLSMLPLHIDNKKKVMGFILNVENILNEVKE